jgi:hypothetical protein
MKCARLRTCVQDAKRQCFYSYNPFPFKTSVFKHRACWRERISLRQDNMQLLYRPRQVERSA